MLNRLAVLTALALLFAGTVAIAAPDTDGDGITDDIETSLGLLPEVGQTLLPIATSTDAGLSDEEAKRNAPDIISMEGCHVGGQRVLLKVTFARSVDFTGATFIIYADLDNDPGTGRVDQYHGGVDVMFGFSGFQMNLTFYGAYGDNNTGARLARDGKVLYLAFDAPFTPQNGIASFGLHLLSQREGGRADSTPHGVAQLPVSAAEAPTLPLGKGGYLRSPSEFRYVGEKVMYERLADKGLRADQVTPVEPIEFGRPRPQVQYFSRGRQPDRPGSVQLRRVPIELLEEAGIARQAAVLSFGFPLPQGALFDLDRIRLADGDRGVPAQFTATGFWADDSLKWVLVDATVPLQAGERRELMVEFGGSVARRAEERSLTPLMPLQGSDLVLVDEAGKRFVGNFGSAAVEQAGPQKVVARAEGAYTAEDGSTYMRYILRATRRAGTPRVELALTHINDYLATEFTDFTSLTATIRPDGGVADARVYLAPTEDEGGRPQPASADGGLVQLDELTLRTGAAPSPGRGTGLVSWRGGSAVAHDFWQRWPKGVAVRDGQVVFDLLPTQPGPDYGADLPYWLMFPFVEGKYRLKWGMAFTERISVDLSGTLSPDELWAEAQVPMVPVIPATWYAETGALGPIAPPQGSQFAVWDRFVEDGFRAYMGEKVRAREYGFLNYGDWFGERGRNWGNNEYDLAHGLFMQFARTGSRDIFRWAAVATQHRADVDTIWAYPDPFNVGANSLHSIGHTGMWTQVGERITWTTRYNAMYGAANGHNWCDGLMDDWLLTGNPRAMESGLAFGEHVAWAMAPTFTALGTHERSAGWSLRSIMALYRATYDPVYLEAAKKIAAVALREQKFDQGGAWPHVLPRDHAGSEQGAVGNNLFLIGVLLGGLQALHQETGDAEVLKSLEAGAEWVVKSFDEKVGGWPYSAKADGTPVYVPTVGLNQLIIYPLAYVGRVTGNERLLQIADNAMAASASSSARGNGKGLAQLIFFSSSTLAELQQYYAKTRPDQGLSVLDGSPESMAALLIRTASSGRHGVRAPDQKVFYLKLRAPQAHVALIRTPHGAMLKRAELATLQALNAAGEVVQQAQTSTDTAAEINWQLTGRPGDQLKIVVNDDQRGVWTLKSAEASIVMQTVPGFRIGGVGRSRLYFMVSQGTAEFSLKLVGVHTGAYGAVVLDPDDTFVEAFQGHNPGAALIVGAPPGPGPTPPDHPERGVLTVRAEAGQTGKIWSVILTTAGDIGVELEGVPPYLALSPEDWFEAR